MVQNLEIHSICGKVFTVLIQLISMKMLYQFDTQATILIANPFVSSVPIFRSSIYFGQSLALFRYPIHLCQSIPLFRYLIHLCQSIPLFRYPIHLCQSIPLFRYLIHLCQSIPLFRYPIHLYKRLPPSGSHFYPIWKPDNVLLDPGYITGCQYLI